MENLENILKNRLCGEDLKEFNRLYYGREDNCDLKIKTSSKIKGEEFNFTIAAYSFVAAKEEIRKQNILRLGLIQHSIVLPTDKPFMEQRQAIFDKIEILIDVAASEGVRILCLQETWSMPFFLCTAEKDKWEEFAESAVSGPSTLFLSKLAKKYEMIIISPILENDDGVWWNTAVVIDENGDYLGKHRKNHLPSVGSFSELAYYAPGNTGHPVFDTKYGKIAINICYGRHHALNWLMFANNGAQIVFNPSATIAEFGQSFWGIEARNAAVANSFFTCSINRVGVEEFAIENEAKKKRSYYGSSYVTSPNGYITPCLSKDRDGLLITEIDLNLCRQVRDQWGFNMTARLEMYANEIEKSILKECK